MKKLLLASAVAAASFSTPSFAEMAGEASVSGGFVSDYYYRGGYLGTSSAYAGAEYSIAGLTAGVWGIKDGTGAARANGSNGVEYDTYLSYGIDVSEELAFSIGYTQYNYDYTSDYEAEVNLGASFGPASLDVAIGSDENPSAGSNADHDYVYAAASVDLGNFNVLVGRYAGEDSTTVTAAGDYTHAEVSTSKTLGETGADLGLILGHTETDAKNDSGDTYIVLDLSVGFDL